MRFFIMLVCCLVIGCGFNPYPYQTKVGYEHQDNRTDKTSSDKDTIKSGETWKIEQIFKWEDVR